MKKVLLAALLLAGGMRGNAQDFAQYVNPMIGTGDHGHVFVGANVPFGMVNAGPTQLETGWDWCSGYHESGKKIIGFGQMHLSGTGCGDLGDIGLMPAYGNPELSREGLASPYRHETEVAAPGYYKVKLDRSGIDVELTATARVALYRFTYPKGSNNARIVIDLENTVGDETREARVVPVDEFTLMGYRRSSGWASNQMVYFCINCIFCNDIIYIYHFTLLSTAVYSAYSLFYSHGIPWKVIIYHHIAELIIQSLRANFCK